MKKWLRIGLTVLCLIALCNPTNIYAASEEKKTASQDLAANAISAVLMDADTGTIIYEKNSHAKLPPASITKVMTLLLTMEAIDAGQLKLTDKVRTSEYAASMGGSQIFLEPGEEMTVDEMLKGISMASGNDASVAIAEKIAGTEEAFVDMMNERVTKLGLKDTHFVNCNGLPAKNHYSSAHDIAVISRELLKHSEITKYTGAYQDHLRKDSDKPFWLVNTNKLVRFYDGADGLKTGYTSEAKFCLSATAVRDGLRAISVVMGEPNTKTRNSEVSTMFDYMFAQYTKHTIYKTGDVIGNVEINKGKSKELQLIAGQPYSVLMKKIGKSSDIRHELQIEPQLKAPIEEGQVLGQLVVYQGDQVIKRFELKSPASVGKAGWWTMFKRTTAKMFFVD
ncbi:D-alanyl-D-alanine carboxypeptidase family protein [Paenibacillus crassostreae]|uniref:D-alanyl-D-alanine carboxypeptidase family protein n=1 Tax=Paenibacillus crassostreae TaxID=1763538 RepID=UPI000A8DB022|nr:D-alanyl-D-alanine carboxypeptidase family protein [Paenibacillus crassostreae]